MFDATGDGLPKKFSQPQQTYTEKRAFARRRQNQDRTGPDRTGPDRTGSRIGSRIGSQKKKQQSFKKKNPKKIKSFIR